MGRARITLKPISNQRTRKSTFMRRKVGLINKIKEFSKMCGVEACLIVYDDANGDVEPVTWPEDPTLVRSIIENYENQKNEKPPKTFDVQDFFDNRKNMIEAEISKVHKQSIEIKYPTWDPSLSNMGEAQLRAFIAQVDAKMRACDHQINMLKNMHQSEANSRFLPNMAQASASNSSHSNQLIYMQDISQSRVILPTPMEPLLNDYNGMLNFTNSTNHVGVPSSMLRNMQQNMQQGNACFSYIPNMAQERATSSHQSQLLNCLENNSRSQLTFEALKQVRENNEMLDFTNQVWSVPVDSTNLLGESLDWSNNLGEWVNRPIGPENWSNQLGGDLVGWASQPNQSTLHNIPVQSQNEQQGVALPALPSQLDGFQTDYYNMPSFNG